MKKFLALLGVAGLLLAAAPQVQAVSLADLFAGQTVTAEDKTFGDWVLINETSTDPAFDPDYSLIDVQPLTGQPLNPGIHFETNGQLQANDLSFLDITFGFSVTSAGAAIEDNSLEITDFTFVGAGGLITILEEVYYPSGAFAADKWVEADNFFGTFNLFDHESFLPSNQIFVTKNILVSSDDFGNFVSLDGFSQNFSQVPEPSTLLLLGGGILGVFVVRRRSRKNG